MADLINLEKVKTITNAETDEDAKATLAAVVELIETYLGVKLLKADITAEKVTLPYDKMRVLRPRFSPINSVSELKFLRNDGAYDTLSRSYSVGKNTIEILTGSTPRGRIAAAEISYNAGLYDSYEDAAPAIKLAAEKLLAWLSDSAASGAFQSENFGGYSYTKGALVRGLPQDIAAILDGVAI